MGKHENIEEGRRVALFKNGSNQAIRIPRDMELSGDEAIIRRDGDRLIIEPVKSTKSLIALLQTLEPIDYEFPEIDDPPPDPVDL